MGSPGGREVGRVSVRVVPDTSRFDDELRRRLRDRDRVRIKVDFDIDEDGFRRKLESIRVPRIHVPVDVDTPKPPPKIPVDADTAEANREVREFITRTERQHPTIHVDTELDRSRLERELQNLRARVQIDADTARLREAIRRATEANDRITKIKLDVDVDRNRISRALSELGSMASSVFSNASSIVGGLASRVSGLASNVGELTGQFSRAGSAALTIVGPIVQAVAIGTALAGIGAAVTAAWATVATAVSALPAALALVAAGAGAVALGMDGIKRAAQTLRPEFDRIRQSVSAAFERGLTPAFQQLKQLVPAVERGMVGVADAISFSATKLAEFVTSGERARMVEQVFRNVQAAIRGMTPGILDATEAMLTLASNGAALGALTGFVNELGRAWKQAVQELSNTGTLTRAFTGLEAVLRSVARAFVDLMTNGVRAFAAMAPGLQSFVDGLTDFFNRFDWNRLGRAVGDVFDGIGEALKKVPPQTIEEITRAFEELGQAFQGAEVQQFIADMIGLLPAALREVTAFVEGIGRAWQSLKDAGNQLRAVWDGVAAAATELWTQIVTSWQGALAFFQSIWQTVAQVATTVWTQITTAAQTAAQFLVTIWQGVVTFFTTLWTQLVTGATTVWTWITTAAQTAAMMIQTAWMTLTTFFQTIWTQIQLAATMAATMIQTAWTALVTFFQTIWTGIQMAATTAWTWIQTAAQTAATMVMTAWSTVTAFFAGLWTQIQAGVSAAWSAIVATISAAWGQIQAAVSAGIAAVSSALQAAWSSIQAAAQSAWQSVLSVVQSAWNSIRSAVQSGVNTVVSAVRSMASQMVSALSSLPSQLAGVGRNAINSLVSAIRAGASAVVNAIVSMVRSAIAAAKSALGIGSPSRVFRDFGKWTWQGFVFGSDDMKTKVLGQMKSIVDEIIAIGQRTEDALATPDGLDDFAQNVRSRIRAELAGTGVEIAGRAVDFARQIVINNYNPIAEKASDTLARKARQLHALGVFG